MLNIYPGGWPGNGALPPPLSSGGMSLIPPSAKGGSELVECSRHRDQNGYFTEC